MRRKNIQYVPGKCVGGGFTLVEAVIVVALVCILSMIGFPSMRELINDLRASTASSEFLAAVSLARSEAISRGRLVTICRSINAESGMTNCSESVSNGHDTDDWGTGWIVFVENGTSTDIGSYNEGEEVLLRHGELQGQTKGVNSTSGKITFNGAGLPTRMGTFSVNFNHDGRHMRQICMARTGRIRVIRDASSC